MDTSRSKTGALTTRAMWAVLAVVIIADVMDLLDAAITNIAAPSIVRDLGGGETLIKWLGSSYALALGVLLVIGGRLGDRYGQRRLFLIGIAGFTIASLACGLSVSPVMLITARLCQGAFGALLIPQGIAIMTAHFSREMMGKAFSLFAFVSFAHRQKTAKNPLIKPSLLANRGFTSGLIMGLVLFTVISGLFY